MKPEQLEIDRLRREVTKLKAERDILKKGRGLRREGWRRACHRFKHIADRMKFAFIAKQRGIERMRLTAADMDMRSARCFAERILRLAQPAAKRAH